MKDLLGNYSKGIYHMVFMASYLFINHVQAINLGKNIKVPAVLVFGDSVVDTGNNNYLETIAKCNFPPYGRDFPGGVPTGRYSNGKVPSDILAEELGIKELVPPYLDPNLKIDDLLTGVSFASGGAGYDPNSANSANALSLEDQLNLLKEYIKKLKATVGENRTTTIISESLYLICAGSNDITNTYFASPFVKLHYDISTYTTLLVNLASSFFQELYALGARRIAVLSAPPCGCLPSQRTIYGGLLRDCSDMENQASILLNNKLSSELTSLSKMLPQSKIVYLDIYNPLLNLISNPSQSGFEVSNKGCCGTGTLEVIILCTNLDPGTCKDASKYVFWDSFHPSEAAYKIIVHKIIQENYAKFL